MEISILTTDVKSRDISVLKNIENVMWNYQLLVKIEFTVLN